MERIYIAKIFGIGIYVFCLIQNNTIREFQEITSNKKASLRYLSIENLRKLKISFNQLLISYL